MKTVLPKRTVETAITRSRVTSKSPTHLQATRADKPNVERNVAGGRSKEAHVLVMRRQKLAALGCEGAQARSILSTALREFCKEIRLYGGLRSVPSMKSMLPAFITSMRSPGTASARVDSGSGDLGEARDRKSEAFVVDHHFNAALDIRS